MRIYNNNYNNYDVSAIFEQHQYNFREFLGEHSHSALSMFNLYLMQLSCHISHNNQLAATVATTGVGPFFPAKLWWIRLGAEHHLFKVTVPVWMGQWFVLLIFLSCHTLQNNKKGKKKKIKQKKKYFPRCLWTDEVAQLPNDNGRYQWTMEKK